MIIAAIVAVTVAVSIASTAKLVASDGYDRVPTRFL